MSLSDDFPLYPPHEDERKRVRDAEDALYADAVASHRHDRSWFDFRMYRKTAKVSFGASASDEILEMKVVALSHDLEEAILIRTGPDSDYPLEGSAIIRLPSAMVLNREEMLFPIMEDIYDRSILGREEALKSAQEKDNDNTRLRSELQMLKDAYSSLYRKFLMMTVLTIASSAALPIVVSLTGTDTNTPKPAEKKTVVDDVRIRAQWLREELDALMRKHGLTRHAADIQRDHLQFGSSPVPGELLGMTEYQKDLYRLILLEDPRQAEEIAKRFDPRHQ